LHLSSECFAIAKLTSSINGIHPLSRVPAVSDFAAELIVQFESNQVTILLHSTKPLPWLRPFLREKVRGDRLSIERFPQPSYNNLNLKLNCSEHCSEDQAAVLTSSELNAISTIKVDVTTSDGWYLIEVTPDSDPFEFDKVNGASPKPKLRASFTAGGVGFLGVQDQEYRVDTVTITPRE
jgi:hypothetical protein